MQQLQSTQWETARTFGWIFSRGHEQLQVWRVFTSWHEMWAAFTELKIYLHFAGLSIFFSCSTSWVLNSICATELLNLNLPSTRLISLRSLGDLHPSLSGEICGRKTSAAVSHTASLRYTQTAWYTGCVSTRPCRVYKNNGFSEAV